MWNCSDLPSATGLGPSGRSVINRPIIYTCVMDTKHEEWRDIDTDKDTGPYTGCDKEQYTSRKASSFGSCHLTCREVCIDQIKLKDRDACSVGLALPGLGGIANLLMKWLEPISHDRMSQSAISVGKHCSKILGLETGGSSLRPSENTRVPGNGLKYIPWLVISPMSCGGFSRSVNQIILP
jgi:hypothetical protein